MKSLLKIVAVLALASVCAGYVYADRIASERNIETRTFVEVVRPGDTFNGIVEQYYDGSIKSNDCWDEWQTIQKQNNARLFANGRQLQPGDRITITTKVRVAK